MFDNYLKRQNKRLFLLMVILFIFYIIDGTVMILDQTYAVLLHHSVFIFSVIVGITYIINNNIGLINKWKEIRF